jgi:hypothetical protein
MKNEVLEITTSPLTIALDYDCTYDADPALWDLFIYNSERAGHKVVLLTYRDANFDKTPLLLELEKKIPVYYTGGVAKRWWSEHFGPGKIDIWIDDRPEAIISNSHYSPEALAEWRKGDRERHYPT